MNRGVIPTTNSWSTFWSFFGRDRSENDQLGSENDQPGSENDQPAFIKSRYRFGSLLDLQVAWKWHLQASAMKWIDQSLLECI